MYEGTQGRRAVRGHARRQQPNHLYALCKVHRPGSGQHIGPPAQHHPAAAAVQGPLVQPGAHHVRAPVLHTQRDHAAGQGGGRGGGSLRA